MGLFDDLDPGMNPVAVDPSPAPAPAPGGGGLFADLDPQPNAPKPQDIEKLLPQLWQRIETERAQALREAEARDMSERALGPRDGGPGQRTEDTPAFQRQFPTMPLWSAQSPDQLRDLLNRESGYDGTLPQRGVAGAFWSGLSGQAQLALAGLLESSGWAANAPVRRPGEVVADQQADAANFAPSNYIEDVASGFGGSLPTMAGIALSRGRSIPGLATAAPTAAIPVEAGAASYLTGLADPNTTPEENLTNSIIEALGTRFGGAFEPGLASPVRQLPRQIGGEALEEGGTSTAQDISSQLQGKDATGDLDLGRSLYQGAVGAGAGSVAAGSMSVPSMLQQALGLTPEQAQAAQQAMAQMQTAALEAQAPANAQRVLNPETGEVFTPAMVTTPRDEPVSVTPEVINAVQDMPSLLKLFGIPDAAKAVGTMSPESLQRVAGEAADPQGQRLADQESEAAIEQEATQADQAASDEQVRQQYQERQDFIRRMQDGRRAARERKEADEAKDAQWRQHVAQQLRQKRTGKIEPDQILNPYDPQWKPDADAVKEAQWKRHVAQKLRQKRTGEMEPVQFPNPYDQEREAAESARREREQQDAQAAEAARRQQIERAQALAAEETSTTQDIPDAIPSEPAPIPQGAPDAQRQAAPATPQPSRVQAPQAAEPVTPTSQPARVESVPVRSIADLDRGFREVYRLKPDEAAAATALVRARAAALGEDPDEYAARTIAEVRHGKGSPSLNQRGQAPELLQEGNRIIPRDESLEFPKLLKQYRKANGDRTPVKGDAEWMRLQQQAAEIDRQNGILYQEDVGNLKDAPRSAETGTRIEKGAISFAEDGRAVLHALQSPDVSTAVHELGHSFRRTLSTQEQAIAGKWSGAKRKNDGTYAWGRAAEEKFARAFERYLRDGTAPNKPLQRIFGKLRDWLRSIYESVKGGPIDIKISPEIRGVFDRMLTPRDQAQAQRLEEGIRTDETRANQPAVQPAAAPASVRPVAQVEEKPATVEKPSSVERVELRKAVASAMSGDGKPALRLGRVSTVSRSASRLFSDQDTVAVFDPLFGTVQVARDATVDQAQAIARGARAPDIDLVGKSVEVDMDGRTAQADAKQAVELVRRRLTALRSVLDCLGG